MATKYPIVMVHGVVLKDFLFFKAFGKIEDKLRAQGHAVFNADHDGIGSIENNAEQIKAFIEKILAATGAEKVNVIAHSKGGLDTLYMIDRLGMKDRIASLTFVSTPHLGSPVANLLYSIPRVIFCPLVGLFNLFYRLTGDQNPDAKTACDQLRQSQEPIVKLQDPSVADAVYMQSFSSTLKRSRDDFVMSVPLMISKHYGQLPGDGMVSVKSSRYANYKGNCTDLSVSHSEIVDLLAKRSKKNKIYEFYINVAGELAQMGF